MRPRADLERKKAAEERAKDRKGGGETTAVRTDPLVSQATFRSDLIASQVSSSTVSQSSDPITNQTSVTKPISSTTVQVPIKSKVTFSLGVTSKMKPATVLESNTVSYSSTKPLTVTSLSTQAQVQGKPLTVRFSTSLKPLTTLRTTLKPAKITALRTKPFTVKLRTVKSAKTVTLTHSKKASHPARAITIKPVAGVGSGKH